MSVTLLTNELNHLISESKRKNADLRAAAEKSLQELKTLPSTSEQQLALDLSRRPDFVNPFLIACSSHNSRYTGSGVSCLQRLIVSKALPRARLQDALEGLNSCTDLSLDVQLKVLQALPSLLQNYTKDLKGDLLSVTLQICASLQAANVPTVSGVAAATLQQLISSVFDALVYEDKHAGEIPAVTEIPGNESPISLRPAAFDTYRVFLDLVLCAEDRKPKFVQLDDFSQEAALDLIAVCINAHSRSFSAHQELLAIIRSNLLPIIITGLSNNVRFSTSVRQFRILDLLLRSHLPKFSGELEVALGLVIHALEPDAAPVWKRALAMEALQRVFAEPYLLVDAYSMFDAAEGGKPIIQDIVASFVRLSTERPSVIGLGQQSTVPTGPSNQSEVENEQSALDAAGGMAGIISTALGVVEANVSGISDQWSLPRISFLDQWDKSEPLPVPETYIYSLVLACLNGLSEALAKIVLPLSVPHDKTNAKTESSSVNGDKHDANDHARARPQRSQSFRKRAVPLNPLELQSSTMHDRVKAVAGLVDSCWPGVLATSSTFFNAALDDRNYRTLIKAFQRFAQVAGLLRLTTPRDALMTLLGKLAVPPHLLSAAAAPEVPKTPSSESPRIFSNPRSLLSVDSLVSPTSSISLDRERRASLERNRPTLTVRNLLCLRALLNLAIALGPTMDSAFSVVADTLKQADMVLSGTTIQQMARQGGVSSQKGTDSPSVVQAFTAEVNAVEAAASRLLESTSDYPNDAFLNVLNAFFQLLHSKAGDIVSSPNPNDEDSMSVSSAKKRRFSGVPGISSFTEMRARDYHFAIPKLSSMAELNISRFVTNDPTESGWSALVDELSSMVKDNTLPTEARRAATNVLCKMSAETILEVSEEEPEYRAVVQRRSFAVLLRLANSIFEEGNKLTSPDIEVHSRIVEAACRILELSGEGLVAGWNKCIAILTCAFERSQGSLVIRDDERTAIEWSHITNHFVTLPLGRAAFAAVQVVCSDFLQLMPTEVMPSVIELIHRFITQAEDLNIALTSITMAWNTLDFLFDESSSNQLSEIQYDEEQDLELETTLIPASFQYRHAQWLLSLLRLRTAIKNSNDEVRKACLQTVYGVFRNHGHQLSPAAWYLVLRSILFQIATDDIENHRNQREGNSTVSQDDMSNNILDGISDLLLQNIGLVEQIDERSDLWEQFMAVLKSYLNLNRYKISAAVFDGLSHILSGLNQHSVFLEDAIYPTASLWSSNVPTKSSQFPRTETNQEAFEKYADIAMHIYRLTHSDITLKQVQAIVNNLVECMRWSDGPLHDANSMSPLQGKVMHLLENMTRDVADSPSFMVEVASRIALFPSRNGAHGPLPTFLALASHSLEWLESIVQGHIHEEHFLSSASLAIALDNLAKVINAKYTVRGKCKNVPVWRQAEQIALATAKPIFDQLLNCKSKPEAATLLLTQYSSILQGIALANGLDSVKSQQEVEDDEDFDIQTFHALREILVVLLQRTQIADETLTQLAESLFSASIIHQPEPVEVLHLPQAPLENLQALRRGRLKQIDSSRRERMAYVCFSEMVKLCSSLDQPPKGKRLAKAVAPFLVLRLAIPIKAYVVDQPLRGLRPKPLSEVEELLFCIQQTGTLECEPEAFSNHPSVGLSANGKAHLRLLYPLLIKAVRVASDRRCGSSVILEALQSVLERINPVGL